MNTATALTIAAIATLTPTVTCIIAYLLSATGSRYFRAEFRSRLDAQDFKLDAFYGQLDLVEEVSHKDAIEIMRAMVALHE